MTTGRTAAPQTPSRRGPTAQSILDAATHLFATRGVSATSVDDIAAAAGTAKGSVYYHFTSKSGLVEALIGEHSDRVSASIREASQSLCGIPLQRAVVATLLTEMQDHPDTARVLVSEAFRTDRSWRESVSTWRDALMAPLAADECGDASGEEGTGARIGAAAIIGATLVAGLEWLVFHPELSLEQVEGQIVSTLRLHQGPASARGPRSG